MKAIGGLVVVLSIGLLVVGMYYHDSFDTNQLTAVYAAAAVGGLAGTFLILRQSPDESVVAEEPKQEV